MARPADGRPGAWNGYRVPGLHRRPDDAARQGHPRRTLVRCPRRAQHAAHVALPPEEGLVHAAGGGDRLLPRPGRRPVAGGAHAPLAGRRARAAALDQRLADRAVDRPGADRRHLGTLERPAGPVQHFAHRRLPDLLPGRRERPAWTAVSECRRRGVDAQLCGVLADDAVQAAASGGPGVPVPCAQDRRHPQRGRGDRR